MGTVRVRYTNRESVFEYTGIRREDAVEKVCEHLALFGQEQLRKPGATKVTLAGDGFAEPSPVPLTTVIAEYIADPTKPDAVETIEIPPLT